MESVAIGQGVTGLPEGVFSGCAALKSVALPEGLTNIGTRAFYGCQSLTSVTIPASVDTIDNGALGYGDSWGTAAPVQGFTIIGTPGTAAEAYADGNGFTFISAGEGSLAGQIAQAQEQITSGLYTSESVAVLQTAIQEAQAVLSDENATQEEIDARMAALQAAINGLELLYPDVIWGDVNDEAGVTASDALTVLQFATGKITLDEKQKVAANVDGKGDVTSADALMVLQYATQKITSFPVAFPVAG